MLPIQFVDWSGIAEQEKKVEKKTKSSERKYIVFFGWSFRMNRVSLHAYNQLHSIHSLHRCENAKKLNKIAKTF